MREPCLRHSPTVRSVIPAILVLGTAGPWCFGQLQPESRDITRTDAYGNARAVNPLRRAVGDFANDVQRMRLRGFQAEGRRFLRRGGTIPFALPGDKIRLNLHHRPLSRFGLSANDSQTRRAFARYGILGTRQPARFSGDPMELLDRTSAILRATAVTAPVRQALSRRGSTLTLTQSSPTVSAAPVEDGQASVSPQSLSESLHGRLSHSAVALQGSGWSYFESRNYRRGMRAFESAAMLNPEDSESRIAEIFCYLSIGSFRTAAASLKQLVRRDAAVLSHPINMTAHYPDQAELHRIRIQCRLFSRSSEHVARGAAIYPFFLWYVGDRREALLEADTLVRSHPNSVYARWSGMMRDVSAAPEGNQPPS